MVISRSAFPPPALAPPQHCLPKLWGTPVDRESGILCKFKIAFVWKALSFCFAQIRSSKRQKRGRERSSSRMKSKCVTFRLTRWRQDWLVAQENSNQDNYIRPPGPPPPPRVSVHCCVILCFGWPGGLAANRWLWGLRLHLQPAPLCSRACRAVGWGGKNSSAHKPSRPRGRPAGAG